MIPVLTLLQMALISILTTFLNPLFWIVMLLVYIQYKRIHSMEIQILGEQRRSLKDKMVNAFITGMVGGIIGTIIIMLLGITIETRDFKFILPLAILLMLINVRYICFSYAGGLLALASLIFGAPKLNVSSILAIVAVLHLIESVLIWTDGDKDAVPIFMENKKYGVVGGFMLQRFWPIPFAILLFMLGPLEGAREINLPEWWPLFKADKAGIDIKNISLQMAAVVAALGYGDMALSSIPKEKCRKSAKRLFVYSVALLLLSVISIKLYIFKFLAAFFAPVAHELLIIYGQKEEERCHPIFRHHRSGVTVLDIQEGLPGQIMGIEQGDVILKINNRFVNSKEEMQEILNQYPPYIWVDIVNLKGDRKTLEYKNYRSGIKSLGIIVVPKTPEVIFDTKTSVSMIKNLFDKGKHKKHKTM
ncbi:PDZ domain-containing protein [Clostridiaceae bacterium 35-E11]